MVTSARTEYKTWSMRRVVRQSVTDWLNPARVAGGALSTALLQETGFRAILGLLIVVSALSFLLIPPFELISGGADSLGSAAVQFGGPALSALIFFLIVAALSVRGRSSMAHALLIGTFVL